MYLVSVLVFLSLMLEREETQHAMHYIATTLGTKRGANMYTYKSVPRLVQWN
jgi:hypothetical protein